MIKFCVFLAEASQNAIDTMHALINHPNTPEHERNAAKMHLNRLGNPKPSANYAYGPKQATHQSHSNWNWSKQSQGDKPKANPEHSKIIDTIKKHGFEYEDAGMHPTNGHFRQYNHPDKEMGTIRHFIDRGIAAHHDSNGVYQRSFNTSDSLNSHLNNWKPKQETHAETFKKMRSVLKDRGFEKKYTSEDEFGKYDRYTHPDVKLGEIYHNHEDNSIRHYQNGSFQSGTRNIKNSRHLGDYLNQTYRNRHSS